MKNTMRDRELMVNIFTPLLPFTYSLSMQHKQTVITVCKKERYIVKISEMGRKKVKHSEDFACNLCRAEIKTKMAARLFYSKD